MDKHYLDTQPPKFKFDVLSSFKDPLSRQLCDAMNIVQSGNLNKKSKYNTNDLCRLVTSISDKDSEVQVEVDKQERAEKETKLCNFVSVMKIVSRLELARIKSNENNNFRRDNSEKERVDIKWFVWY